MKLNALQRRILGQLESIPIAASEFSPVGLLEKSRMQAAMAVTGMLRSLRRNLPVDWDPWILQADDRYRLFYLRGQANVTPWWTFSKICGAVSSDLQHWQDLGTLLEPNPENAWEAGRVCAGCTYQEKDRYYLFYSAGGKELPDLRQEAIGLATSTDGLHWQRQTNFWPLQPDDRHPWYGYCHWTNHLHWRDPYVFKDPNSDRYYLYICASSSTPGNFQGCIAVAVADAIEGRYEILPPVVSATEETANFWPFYHMERPQVFFKNNQYHLFFSCFRRFLNPQWMQTENAERITNSSLYWYVSDRPTGPFTPVDRAHFIVPNSEKTGLYGTTLLPLSSELEEFIAYGWYHRLQSLEVSPTFRATWQDSVLKLVANSRNPLGSKS